MLKIAHGLLKIVLTYLKQFVMKTKSSFNIRPQAQKFLDLYFTRSWKHLI